MTSGREEDGVMEAGGHCGGHCSVLMTLYWHETLTRCITINFYLVNISKKRFKTVIFHFSLDFRPDLASVSTTGMSHLSYLIIITTFCSIKISLISVKTDFPLYFTIGGREACRGCRAFLEDGASSEQSSVRLGSMTKISRDVAGILSEHACH